MNARLLNRAKKESKKSKLSTKVGAVMEIGNTVVAGHNKAKTHPEFANPEKHTRKSLHAELDCLIKARNNKFPGVVMGGGTVYVYRDIDGKPAMARPCEHCMSFLKKAGIKKVVYTTETSPYLEMEEI